jgi:hypothetical protein
MGEVESVEGVLCELTHEHEHDVKILMLFVMFST